MVNKDFLKQVLCNQKELLALKDVKQINPPKYDEISVCNLYLRYCEDPKFMAYMPDHLPKGKLPDRRYFFNVLNTVYEAQTQRMIEHANKVRFESAATGIQEDAVAVSDDWWEKLNLMPYFSCKSDGLLTLST
jgi:hypothetical protein